MLTIIKRMSAVLTRPKYYPTSRHAQWCVYDTETKLTVYGPETRSACQRYIQEEETKMSEPKNNNVAVEYENDGVIEYPMIMQNAKSGTVFLITGRRSNGMHKGFILADGTANPAEMGRFSEKWKKDLVPFTGSITLSNRPS